MVVLLWRETRTIFVVYSACVRACTSRTPRRIGCNYVFVVYHRPWLLISDLSLYSCNTGWNGQKRRLIKMRLSRESRFCTIPTRARNTLWFMRVVSQLNVQTRRLYCVAPHPGPASLGFFFVNRFFFFFLQKPN